MPAPAGPVTAEVTGFRSARFGMTEAQVRAAIEKDFRMQAGRNPLGRKQGRADPSAGRTGGRRAARGWNGNVSYVFGFKSKTLIQVGLSWSKATDEKMTPEQLFSNGNILRSHFLEVRLQARHGLHQHAGQWRHSHVPRQRRA